MDETTNMGEKLAAAGQKAEEQKNERRSRAVKGSHLTEAITTALRGSGLTEVEKTGFFQYAGPAKGRKIYVAKKGGRVDLSGFSVPDAAAVTQISEEEAKTKHLGKVRGQVNFESTDELVLEAIQAAISLLNEPTPEAPAKAAKKKEPATEQNTPEQAAPADETSPEEQLTEAAAEE